MMSIFKKTPMGISRKDLRLILKEKFKTSPSMTQNEVSKMEKEVFPGKMGDFISERDLSSGLNKLKQERWKANFEERRKINREIDILNKLKK